MVLVFYADAIAVWSNNTATIYYLIQDFMVLVFYADAKAVWSNNTATVYYLIQNFMVLCRCNNCLVKCNWTYKDVLSV
jgi:hypothetical protein